MLQRKKKQAKTKTQQTNTKTKTKKQMKQQQNKNNKNQQKKQPSRLYTLMNISAWVNNELKFLETINLPQSFSWISANWVISEEIIILVGVLNSPPHRSHPEWEQYME